MEIRVFLLFKKKKSLENCFIAAYDSHLICYEIKIRTYLSLITSFEENFTARKSGKLSGRLTILLKRQEMFSIETTSSLIYMSWYMCNGSVSYQLIVRKSKNQSL